MKALLRAAAAATIIGLAGGLGGCASLITGGELIRPGEPTGAIRVNNVGRGVINVVLISDCSAASYGLNRLPSGTAIPSGRSYDFTVSAGCWDVAVGRVGYGDVRRRLTVMPGGVFTYSITD